MRKYEETHPWITFHVNLERAPARLWMLLGECQSDCEHIAVAPLRPDTAKDLYHMYLAREVWGTTAIEGNTLSEEQVRQLLDGKLKLPPSQDYLRQEVQNIVDQCNGILNKVCVGHPLPLNRHTIGEFNRSVLAGLALDEDVVPGQVRRHSVGVARYRGAPAEDCKYLLDHLCSWLESATFAPPEGVDIAYAIIKAVLAHLYIAWIHPFADGNGRTARLVEHQILIAAGVPSTCVNLLSDHYNHTRTQYYRQLGMASGSGGDVVPFLLYAVQGLRDGLREQLETVRIQQLDVAWRNYIHEMFRDRSGAANQRRRRLVLDLSREEKPVPFDRLSDISTKLVRAYVGKTTKTLSRDINELIEMNLVEKREDGYRARTELILSYLPYNARLASTTDPAARKHSGAS